MSITKLLRFRMAAVGALLTLLGCALSAAADVATPVLRLEAGSNSSQVDVRVSVTTPNAVIRYRTDGADPTTTDPSLSSGGVITLSSNVIFKAKAWDGNLPATLTPSAVATAVCNVNGMVSAGLYATLALLSDGRIVGAGTNTNGELGDGTTTNRSTPVFVMSNVATGEVFRGAVSVSGKGRIAVRSDGTVWRWSTIGQVSQVMKAAGQPLTGAVMTSGTYVLLSDGSVWSGTDFVRVNASTILSGIVAIEGGSSHLLALDNTGRVWSVGPNFYGQLGDGTFTERTYAVKVQASSGVDLVGVASIGTGNYISFAVKTDGTVFGWGRNILGQLGDGTTTDRSYPVQMKSDASSIFVGVRRVVGGENHTLIMKTDGTVWAVGNNAGGQLGDGTTTNRSFPVPVLKDANNVLTNVVGISAGSSHSVALDKTGKVYTWGRASEGQLGNGGILSPTFNYATAYSQWPNLAYVKTDLAVTVTGTAGAYLLTATPSDPQSQIAQVDFYQGSSCLGSATSSPWQLSVASLAPGQPVTAVFLSATGWVTNTATAAAPVLQLETGSSTGRLNVRVTSATPGAVIRYTSNGADPTPADPIVPSSGVVGIGNALTFKAKAWDGNAPSVLMPSSVTSAFYDLFPKVGAGPQTTYVIKHDRTARAAGNNGARQLGDPMNSTATVSTPVLMKEGSPLYKVSENIVSISGGKVGALGASAVHVMVVKEDGSLWGFGTNLNGQVGSGSVLSTVTELGRVLKGANQPLNNVIATAVGDSCSYALCSDGTVWAWGINNYGQLGDGTTTNHSYAAVVKTSSVSPLSGIIAIAAGNGHMVALDNTGKVWSCGYNASSQLGDGTTTNRSYAVKVQASAGTDLTGVTGITAGASFCLAVKNDGSVCGWGSNSGGQLGTGGLISATYPVQTKLNSTTFFSGARKVEAGPSHAYILKNDGTLWGVGNASSTLGDGTNSLRTYPVQVKKNATTFLTDVAGVATGTQHAVAIDGAGVVYTWGLAGAGQLGNGALPTTTSSYATAYSPWALQGYTQPQLNLDVTSAVDGSPASFVLTASLAEPSSDIVRVDFFQGGNYLGSVTSGSGVWRWMVTGASLSQPFSAVAYNSAGLASSVPVSMPPVADPVLQIVAGGVEGQYGVRVTSATPNSVIRYTTNGAIPSESDPVVVAGDMVTVPASATLKAKAWDDSASATLSPSATKAITYHPLGTVRAADSTSFGLKYDGRVLTTTGSTMPPSYLLQSAVQNDILRGVVSVHSGLAAKRNGTVWARGNNSYGQLGNGTAGANTSTAYHSLVLRAPGIPLADVISVVQLGSSSYALGADGTVWSWGLNANGQLGDGSTTNRAYAGPVMVNAGNKLTNIVSISGEGYKLLALDQSGKVWRCGVANQLFATKIQASGGGDFGGVVSIRGGSYSSNGSGFAVKADGTVWAWGNNDVGQLGDGTTTTRTLPVQMKADAANAFTDVRAVSVYGRHTYLRRNDGSVWAVGDNSSGQLGNGTTTSAVYPVRVKTDSNNFLTDIVSMDAGSLHGIASDRVGTVYTWGAASAGQLGNAASTSPTSTYATAYPQWPNLKATSLALNLSISPNSTTDPNSVLLVVTSVGSADNIERVDFYRGTTLLGSIAGGSGQLAVTLTNFEQPVTAVAYGYDGMTGPVAGVTPHTVQLPLARVGHGFAIHQSGAVYSVLYSQVKGVTDVDASGRFVMGPDAYLEVVFSVPSSASGDFWVSDETSGELSQANTLDLRTAPWALDEPFIPGGTVSPSYIRHLMLPLARDGHSFAYMLDGGAGHPVTLNAARSATGINPASGLLETHDIGFISATAYPMGSGTSFHIVDLTAMEQGPGNTIDLRSSAWEPVQWPNTSRPLQIALSNSDNGFEFTLHTSAGGLSGKTAGLVDFPSANYTGVGLLASVPAGTTFWLTRNGGIAESPRLVMGANKQFVDWRGVFPPARNLQTVRFHIGANRHGHAFKVVQPDGYEAPLTVISSNNKLETWEDSNGTGNYFYDAYDAKIDAGQSWSLHDTTTSENLGQRTSVLEGWALWHLPPPSGHVALNINEYRHGHTFILRQGDGTETPVQSAPGYEDPGVYIEALNRWYAPNPYYESTAPIRYFPASAAYDPAQSFKIIDTTTGEEREFAAGTTVAELSLWGGAPEPLDLDISVTRWNHELVLLQTDGSSFPVTRGNVQGGWFFGNPPWFSTFNYFDATTKARPGLSWWIYDVTTGEMAGSNGGDLGAWLDWGAFDDTDYDGLYDWYEFILGTDKNNADSDGDGIPDLWEAQYGLDPNDPEDASALAASGDMTNWEKFEHQLDPGTNDTDADGIPDRWELDHDLNPKEPGDANQYATGELYLTNLQVYQGYTTIELRWLLARSGNMLRWKYTDTAGNSVVGYLEAGSLVVRPLDAEGKVLPGSYLGGIAVCRLADISPNSFILVDATTAEEAPVAIVNRVADGRNVVWTPSSGGGRTINCALPMERRSHNFVVVGMDGTTGAMTKFSEQGRDVYDEQVQNFVFKSYGFFNARAYVETTTGDIYVVDVTTMEQALFNGGDLVFSSWSPFSIPAVTRPITIRVADHEAGFAFTLHSSSGTMEGVYPELLTIRDPETWESVTGYFLTGAVGMGSTVWITRDVDLASSPSTRVGINDAYVDWSDAFARVHNWQLLTFRIGGIRKSHNLIVRHDEAALAPSLQDPVPGQFVTWDDAGIEVRYDYYTYQVTVDTNQNWRLYDQTTNEDLGVTRDVLEGWNAWHPAAPEGFVSIKLPQGRRGRPIQLRQADGTTWSVTPAAGYENPSSYLEAWNTYFVGKSDQRTTEIRYFPAVAPYDPAQSFTVVDLTTGEEQSAGAGVVAVDLMQWYSAPKPLILDISVVRWAHDLYLHQASGESFPIVRGSLQGTWAPDPNNRSWFISYNFFDGATQAHEELEWWVYDATTGESSPPNTSDLTAWMGASVTVDTDTDGLPDWYEFMLGTSITNSDSDNDGIPDEWEVRFGLDPRDPADAGYRSGQGGLTNLQRYVLATSPVVTDSDGDGTPDTEEIGLGRNPFAPDDPRVKLKVRWFVAP